MEFSNSASKTSSEKRERRQQDNASSVCEEEAEKFGQNSRHMVQTYKKNIPCEPNSVCLVWEASFNASWKLTSA